MRPLPVNEWISVLAGHSLKCPPKHFAKYLRWRYRKDVFRFKSDSKNVYVMILQPRNVDILIEMRQLREPFSAGYVACKKELVS
jgi:hypothetical protein